MIETILEAGVVEAKLGSVITPAVEHLMRTDSCSTCTRASRSNASAMMTVLDKNKGNSEITMRPEEPILPLLSVTRSILYRGGSLA